MSDPKRLLDGAGDDLEVALLSAGRDEQPSARVVEKTLLAIGAGGTMATGAAAATAASELAAQGAAAAGTVKAATAGTAAAGATKAATAGALVAPVAAKASVPVLVAWTGVAAAGGFGTLSAIDYLSEPSSPVPVTAPAPSSPAADRGQVTARPATPVGAVAAAKTEDPEPVSTADTDDPSKAEPGREAQSDAPGVAGDPQANVGGADAVRKRRLADEVAALDQARSAIGAGDGAGALRALDRYDGSFETRMLGPEARTLRIEALLLAGRRGEARAAAARFLADHPSSTHARRIRSLVEAKGAASPVQP